MKNWNNMTICAKISVKTIKIQQSVTYDCKKVTIVHYSYDDGESILTPDQWLISLSYVCHIVIVYDIYIIYDS